ncbi:uncharacterized protein LOC142180000 [Nicotiana tabacum]|uniref:Uncharacterized protein LOC142180000 n=1 Tax=Nicotiana tabacum TaxID=4097 RepID=A0AC58UBZ5_TOBAC
MGNSSGNIQKGKEVAITNLMTGEMVLLAKRYKNIYVANFESLHNLVKKVLVRGLPESRFKGHKVYDACVRGKQVRSSFKPNNEIQVKMSYNVVSIRYDHGTEFGNAKFDKFCAKYSISHNFSAPRTPQQKGVVERKNRTLEYMVRTMLMYNGVEKGFWAEGVNTACYLVNMCLIRSLMNKTPYELLNGRKPKLTYLRTFGCKCFVLNNGKEALGNFDAKSNEGIFLGYSSQSKAYKVYNKKTQCVKESIHVIFDESHHLCGKHSNDKIDQDKEQSKVPREFIDMANGKAELMSQVKEFNEENTTKSLADAKELGSFITITEAEDRVADAVQGTPDAEQRCAEHRCGIQTRSKTRNSFDFSVFLSQIEPRDIKEALKDADWITAMQDELHQFERTALYGLKQAPSAWYERLSKFILENGFTRGKIDNTLFLKKRGRNLLIVQVYVGDIIFGATNDSMCKEFAKLMGSEFEMSMIGELNFFLGLQVKQTPKGMMISQ